MNSISDGPKPAGTVRAMSAFCLALFSLSLFLGVPSFAGPRTAFASSHTPTVSMLIDPRPPVLLADSKTYAALVLEFVNESSNLPAVPTKNVTILLSSSNPQVGNVSASVVFPAGQIYYIADLTTTFIAGTTKITGLSNASMPSIPGSATVTTTLGAGDPNAFELFANPTTIPAKAGFNSSIVVEAVDSQHDPVAVPQAVNVALSSSRLAIGNLPVSVTISQGASFASANFTATNSPGPSTISASANGFSPAQIQISTIVPVAGPSALSVQVSPSGLIADGQVYPNVVSVSLLDSNGNPSVANSTVVVNLNVSSTTLSLGSLGATEVTIPSGLSSAYISFNASKISGTTEIFASAPGFVSSNATLTLLSPPSVMLALYSIPTPVLAGGATYQSLIAVQLQQSGGAPSEATSNVFVELGTEGNSLGTVSSSVVIPAGSDYAFVNLTTESEAGSINVSAIASGYLSASVTVSSVFLPASVSISESASSLPNTASSRVAITASSEGAALIGANVAWFVTGGPSFGTFNQENLVTNSSGIASATFHPGTVIGSIQVMVSVSKPDYLPSNTTGTLTVYSEQISAVLSGLPDPTPVLNTSALKVVVSSTGGPLANASVQWSASAGSILNASAVTNVNGTAFAVFKAGPNATSVQIQAKVSKSGYFTYLANLTDDIYIPTFTVQNTAPQSVLGGDNASIAIQVRAENAPASNASVDWQIVSGPIVTLVGASHTNSTGYATAVFVAGETAGEAEISALISKNGIPSYTDDVEVSVDLLNMTVQVIEPHPSIVENYHSPFAILVSQGGKPIVNASLKWTAVGGTLVMFSSSTNTSGYAAADFLSGSQPGNMSVRAFIQKPGYYNYSELIYFVVVVPSLGGTTGNSGVGTKNVLFLNLGNLIPVWVLISMTGAGAAAFMLYRHRKQNTNGYYYNEE